METHWYRGGIFDQLEQLVILDWGDAVSLVNMPCRQWTCRFTLCEILFMYSSYYLGMYTHLLKIHLTHFSCYTCVARINITPSLLLLSWKRCFGHFDTHSSICWKLTPLNWEWRKSSCTETYPSVEMESLIFSAWCLRADDSFLDVLTWAWLDWKCEGTDFEIDLDIDCCIVWCFCLLAIDWLGVLYIL